MNRWIRIGAVGLLLAVLVGSADAQTRRDGKLQVGDFAPDFTLQDVEGNNEVRLSDLRGRPVVLVFGSCT